MSPDEGLPEADLNAFIDGELDAATAAEVQRYLGRHPDAAARVMLDMAVASALRVSAGAEPAPSRETVALAERLTEALASSRKRRGWSRAAVVTLVFLAGLAVGRAGLPWNADGVGRAPEFVDEAVMSHRTALLRARMDSQPEAAIYNPQEIRAATRIALPPLPADWRVTDAQVFPSDEGPSVGLAFVTPQGPVSLFGFHTESGGWIAPTTVQRDRGPIAYWQAGDLAYALIGPADPEELRRLAVRLSNAAVPKRTS
jgi:anti-sigma factor RsiW